MSIYYSDEQVTLHHGDCLEVMGELPDASVHAVVTDPPYGLEFMSRKWDAPWQEPDVNADAGFNGGGIDVTNGLPSFTGSTNPKCLRCGGTRRGRRDGTAERAVCLCEDGGRFPNVRAVEMRAFGDWCSTWVAECLRVLRPGGYLLAFGGTRTWHRLAVAVEDAGFEIRDSIAWLYGSGFPKSLNVGDGRGTALKPAFEPIVVGRKPLSGTVAATVLAHGTGALNIDACRTEAGQDYRDKCASVVGLDSNRNGAAYGDWTGARTDSASDAGRWPTNVVLDKSQAAVLDGQSGPVGSHSVGRLAKRYGYEQSSQVPSDQPFAYGDSGGASRFFPTFRYEAKAPSSERPSVDGVQHPTVKPLDLMRWLVRLVTPPGGTVLEPFAGSGTTAEACVHEHRKCIAIEREAEYLPLIVTRLTKPIEVGFDFGEAS